MKTALLVSIRFFFPALSSVIFSNDVGPEEWHDPVEEKNVDRNHDHWDRPGNSLDGGQVDQVGGVRYQASATDDQKENCASAGHAAAQDHTADSP
jgi:hypothetical protein